MERFSKQCSVANFNIALRSALTLVSLVQQCVVCVCVCVCDCVLVWVVCRVGDGACGGVGVGVCVWPYLLNVWKLEAKTAG